MFNPTSPLTGLAVTGLTSPTFTLTTDAAPFPNGKQWAITALGGTQPGVVAHSVSMPYTLTFVRPSSIKSLPAANPITGVINSRPKNRYKLITRKGTLIAANTSSMILIETYITIPAGAEAYSPNDIRSAISMHEGALSQQKDGIVDTCQSGIA